MYWDYNRIDVAGGVNTVSGTTPTSFVVGAPQDFKRVIAVVTTGTTVAASTVTIAVNGVSIGTIAIPVAASGAVFDAIVAGKPLVATGSDGSAVNGATSGVVELSPGDTVSFTSDGGSTAGAVQFFYEYVALGFSGERVADVTRLPVTFA